MANLALRGRCSRPLSGQIFFPTNFISHNIHLLTMHFNSFHVNIMLLIHHFYFAWTECGNKCHIIIQIYTFGKKGCYTPIEDNKTNVDRAFVFPLGWNEHDMDPWLFPNEIRHYLGQTINARLSGIVDLRNHSIGGRSPKSTFTLWQLWINICIFF